MKGNNLTREREREREKKEDEEEGGEEEDVQDVEIATPLEPRRISLFSRRSSFPTSFHPSLLRLISLPFALPPTAPSGQSERGVEQSYAIPGCVAARAITICVVVARRPARDVAQSGHMWSRGKAAKAPREREPSRAHQCLLGRAPKAPKELQEGPPDPSCPSQIVLERPSRALRRPRDGLRRPPNRTYQSRRPSLCFERAPRRPNA